MASTPSRPTFSQLRSIRDLFRQGEYCDVLTQTSKLLKNLLPCEAGYVSLSLYRAMALQATGAVDEALHLYEVLGDAEVTWRRRIGFAFFRGLLQLNRADAEAVDDSISKLKAMARSAGEHRQRAESCAAVLAAGKAMSEQLYVAAAKILEEIADDRVVVSRYCRYCRLHFLGRCQFALGNIDDGLDAFRRAFEVFRPSSVARGDLVCIYAGALMQTGRASDAINVVESELSQRKRPPRHEHRLRGTLADAYATNGDVARAGEEYQSLLASNFTATDARQRIHGWLVGHPERSDDVSLVYRRLCDAAEDIRTCDPFRDFAAAHAIALAAGDGQFVRLCKLAGEIDERNGTSTLSRACQLFARGSVALTRFSPRAAEDYFDELLRLESVPQELDVLRQLARLQRAQAVIIQLRFADAVAQYRTIAADVTVDGRFRNKAAIGRRSLARFVSSKAVREGDLDETLPCPEFPVEPSGLLLANATSALRFGQPETAYELARTVAIDDRESFSARFGAHFVAAASAIAAGKLGAAAGHASRIVAMSPGYAVGQIVGRVMRAAARFHRGRYQSAMADVTAAKKFVSEPGQSHPLVRYVEALATAGPAAESAGLNRPDRDPAEFELELKHD